MELFSHGSLGRSLEKFGVYSKVPKNTSACDAKCAGDLGIAVSLCALCVNYRKMGISRGLVSLLETS